MTRTNKWNEHKSNEEPRWFSHNGNYLENPNKVKKEGAGKNNWGQPGDELLDDEELTFLKPTSRRNSNHSQNEEELNEVNEEVNRQFFSEEKKN